MGTLFNWIQHALYVIKYILDYPIKHWLSWHAATEVSDGRLHDQLVRLCWCFMQFSMFTARECSTTIVCRAVSYSDSLRVKFLLVLRNKHLSVPISRLVLLKTANCDVVFQYSSKSVRQPLFSQVRGLQHTDTRHLTITNSAVTDHVTHFLVWQLAGCWLLLWLFNFAALSLQPVVVENHNAPLWTFFFLI